MLRKRFCTVLSIILILSLVLVGQAFAAPGDTTRVSIASDGTQGDGGSEFPGISADGRYVAFASRAANLVPGDTNGVEDIFLRDRQTNMTTRLSIASDGTQPDDDSYRPVISANGRFVVFSSLASNLVPGDTNGVQDVFLRDTQTNTTTLVSVGLTGSPATPDSFHPAISADGRYVTFCSWASNLVPGDTNGVQDVFLRDRQTNTTTRLSVASDGTQGNDGSGLPSISADGRYVAFVSGASNLVPGDTNGTGDIFLRDRVTNTTTRISVASNGTQANDNSLDVAISADGRFAAFSSIAGNLVAGDTNIGQDIFLRDLQTDTTTLLSISSNGVQGIGDSDAPTISADDRYVVFYSNVENLVPGDTNGHDDIFMRDRQTSTTTLISVSSNGTQENSGSFNPVISADGSLVAFESQSSNLVAGDTNNNSDIFVHETGTRVPTRTPRSAPASNLPSTGFAPDAVSALAAQPADKSYTDQGMSLEIPSLNLKAPLVGVPQAGDGTWDLTWLGGDIGYLQGTAFPTWAGNSVLTGHVYGADGRPGPFVNLGNMGWGQQVIVHAWGQQYIYAVRSVSVWVDPADTDVLTRHEAYPWLTLITCRDYDAHTNHYRWRTVVRAVLVKIQNEP